jgi:hypothetical protein
VTLAKISKRILAHASRLDERTLYTALNQDAAARAGWSLA